MLEEEEDQELTESIADEESLSRNPIFVIYFAIWSPPFWVAHGVDSSKADTSDTHEDEAQWN